MIAVNVHLPSIDFLRGKSAVSFREKEAFFGSQDISKWVYCNHIVEVKC